MRPARPFVNLVLQTCSSRLLSRAPTPARTTSSPADRRLTGTLTATAAAVRTGTKHGPEKGALRACVVGRLPLRTRLATCRASPTGDLPAERLPGSVPADGRRGSKAGEVVEWLKAPHSKCGIRATVSWVRIPPSPPKSSLPIGLGRLTDWRNGTGRVSLHRRDSRHGILFPVSQVHPGNSGNPSSSCPGYRRHIRSTLCPASSHRR